MPRSQGGDREAEEQRVDFILAPDEAGNVVSNGALHWYMHRPLALEHLTFHEAMTSHRPLRGAPGVVGRACLLPGHQDRTSYVSKRRRRPILVYVGRRFNPELADLYSTRFLALLFVPFRRMGDLEAKLDCHSDGAAGTFDAQALTPAGLHFLRMALDYSRQRRPRTGGRDT